MICPAWCSAGWRESPPARNKRPQTDLIGTAWGVDADKVVGGPDWLDSDRFDVRAPSTEALPVLLRKILTERFQLVAHTEMKGAPAYAISMTEALSGQLGLRLQARKVMTPVLVVERVNGMPTAN